LSDQLDREPTDIDRKILALGFNYDLTQAIVFKAEFEFVQDGNRKETVDNNTLAFQVAFRF